jgi:uncharacterized membrane protein
MRAILSLLGLMVVLLVVGLLAKKQMTAVSTPPLSAAGTVAAPAVAPQHQVQQFRQNLDAALQQARPIPDER